MDLQPDSYTALVRAVANQEPEAESALYDIFNRGMRFLIARQTGSESLDDIIHSCFVDVLQSIRQGRIDDPERLPGYIRIVVQRKIMKEIRGRMEQRASEVDLENWEPLDVRPSAELEHATGQEVEIATEILKRMNPVVREVLIRFYMLEHNPKQICQDLGLTQHQFRNFKCRGKSAFTAKLNRVIRRPVKRSKRNENKGSERLDPVARAS